MGKAKAEEIEQELGKKNTDKNRQEQSDPHEKCIHCSEIDRLPFMKSSEVPSKIAVTCHQKKGAGF